MWFTENPWPPMLIAALAAVVFLMMWSSNRRGLHFVLAVACLLAAAGIYLLERLIVTDGERLQQRVVQLCFDFRDKKPEVVGYVSDSFPQLKDLFTEALAKRDVALQWCSWASEHAHTYGGKPWKYALIPHDAIAENITLEFLLKQYS